MAAEIVVIVEDQHAGLRLRRAIERGGGEPADSAADDDKIIALDRAFRLAERRAVAQAMRGLERAGMAAAHSCQRGRVGAPLVLRRRRRGECGARQRGAERNGCPVEKITPVDGAIHSQFPVASRTASTLSHVFLLCHGL